MKNCKFHTTGTVQKLNKNHGNRVKINIHKTEIHDHSIPFISTGNQLKVTGLNNSLWAASFYSRPVLIVFFIFNKLQQYNMQ